MSGFADLIRNPAVGIVVTLVAIMIVQFVMHTFLDRIIEHTVRRQKHSSQAEEHQREKTLKTIFRTMTGIALWVVGVVIVLWELHVNVAALLTGAGLVSIVAGLGAQNIIKDWLAGIFIILENQYRIDDIVQLTTTSGVAASGVVEDISIRLTKLRGLDGNLQIVTNGTVAIISNMSFRFANVNVDVLLSYDADIDLVERLINEVGIAMAGDDQWKSKITEAIQFLRVDNFTDTSVTIKALGKVHAGAQWAIAGDFRKRLHKAFQKHHIPAPTQNITVNKSKNS